MKKVLLHICCGICAIASIRRLQEEGFYVEGLFFNPNIHPEEEYLRRLAVARQVGLITATKIIESVYEPQKWQDTFGGFSDEPEGGKRCVLCYEYRLKETFAVCRENSFDYFTSTLTISPHKDSAAIFQIGRAVGAEHFLAVDFKKKDGFKIASRLAREHNLYRQNYCGCAYSKGRAV
jgi:predicted adenine nucleotide alpha hydrolase (AANH) superfamily ATPase